MRIQRSNSCLREILGLHTLMRVFSACLLKLRPVLIEVGNLSHNYRQYLLGIGIDGSLVYV